VFGVTPRKYITKAAVLSSATKIVPENSLAIITRVGVGKLAIMPFSYTTSQDFLSLSKLRTDVNFTAYLLYKKLQSELNSVQGTSIKGITKDELLAKEVSVPDRKEQEAIGRYFRNLDNLITLHLREFTKSNSSIFVSVSIYANGLPAAWELRKAKDLFTSTADKGHPELPVLSATQDRGMIKRDDNGINIFHDKKNEEGYKRVVPGQFVIHLRSFQGGFAHSAIEGITSPAYTVFGFQEPKNHDDNYWKYIFSSKEFIRRLETVTYGIRDGRSISYDEFLTMVFSYPQKEEQARIAAFLDKTTDLITLHLRKYSELFL